MENKTLEFLSEALRIFKDGNNTLSMSNISSQLKQKRLTISRGFKEKCQPYEVCKFCGNNWDDSTYSLHFSGHNLKMKKHKLKCERNPSLSTSRKNILSFFDKRKDNVMVKTCLICKATTKYGINNHNLKKQEENNSFNSTINSINYQNPIKKKRKKKSLKKSFAGLSPAAVSQARLSSGLLKTENAN